MKREIKFRGKRNNGKWAYGSLVYSENIQPAIYFEVGKGAARSFDWCYVDPDTVGQFTGMRDKNEVKIFEGDIVRVCDEDEDDIDIGVVKYIEAYGKYVVVYSQESGNWFDFEDTDGGFMAADCSEVIGNIYDNPDLLNEK